MIRLSTLVAVLALAVALVPAPRGALAQDVTAGVDPGAPPDPWGREVAVADRGPEERRAAQSLAMREVLLANSGDKTLLNRDDVRAGLRDAESYVERFDYRAPPPGTVIAPGTPLTDRVRESGEATQLMRVTFDRARLGELIAGGGDEAEGASSGEREGDPFVGVETALLWLLIEDGRRRILVSDPAARNVRARAREIAGARGLALRYPSGDDEDAATIGPEAIRDASVDRLRLASERYAEPVVLSGALAREGLDAWQGNWTKFAGDVLDRATFSTDSLDAALQAGIAWLSTTAGGEDVYRYGGEAASDTEALVWVGALDSVGAYATVMNFLAGVPGVGTVYPKEIDELGMTFTVVPRGALPAIASAADGLAWLRRTNPPAGTRGMRPDAGSGAFGSSTGGGERVVDREADERFADRRTPDARTPDARRLPPAPLARDAELAFDYLR